MSDVIFPHCPQCTSPMSTDPVEGYYHCTRMDCNFVQYLNPTPVVAAVVEYEHEQLVLAHNASWPEGWFGLITGFLERYEHPDQAIIREVKEELGLQAQASSLIGHYTFERMNQLIIAYHVKVSGTVVLNDELDAYRIIPYEKVQYWPSGTGFALRDHLQQRGFSPLQRSFK